MNDVWVFGYGSLLWDTGGVQPLEESVGYLEGWHREWRWISERRHDAPTCSLVPGGRVKGKFLRLNPATASRDLQELRKRERKSTEQQVENVPRDGAVTYFWTMGENLQDYEEFRNLEGHNLLRALAVRARGLSQSGPDGVTAADYIRRVHIFDPEDQLTATLVRLLSDQ